MTEYAFVQGKGGTGKTSAAAEAMLALTRAGRSVVGIDLDEQGNLTVRCGVTEDTEIYNIAAEVMSGDATVEEAAIPAPSIPGASIIVATHELGDLNVYKVPDLVTGLRDHLRGAPLPWDDVVIDTPPRLDGVTLAAIAAADVVIVPTDCARESAKQIERVQAVIDGISRRIRPGAQIDWIIPNGYDSRRSLDRAVVEELRSKWAGRVTGTIRSATAVAQAYDAGTTVGRYAPGSPVAGDYTDVLGGIIRATL